MPERHAHWCEPCRNCERRLITVAVPFGREVNVQNYSERLSALPWKASYPLIRFLD